MPESPGLPPEFVDEASSGAMREALDAGDLDGFRRILAELHERIAPESPPVSDEVISLLMRLRSVEGTETAEDPEQFATFINELRRTFSPQTFATVMGVFLFMTGLEDGKMPADTYDTMLGFLETAGFRAAAEGFLGRIERRG